MTVNVYIDPAATGGGTGVDWTNAYTTLNAGIVAKAGTITEPYIFHCRSSGAHPADEANVTFNGYSGLSSSNTITVTVDIADRQAGVWDDTKYRLVPTTGKTMLFYDSFINIIGLQLSSPNGFIIDLLCDLTGTVKLEKCLIKGNSTSDMYGIQGRSTAASSILNVYNCLIYDVSGTASYAINCNTANQSINAVNCTCHNNTRGLRAVLGSFVAINNLMYLSGGDTYTYTPTVAFAAGTDYNVTDSADGIGTGSNNKTGHTFTFVDHPGNDFHLQSSDEGAIGFGTNHGLFTDDVDEQTRTVPYDCGFDEYVSGAPASVFAFS